MILSNSTSSKTSSSDLDKKSIVTLGDTLAARGFLLAAHFCYLVAQVEFGSYSNKASKLVLLSSSASQSFESFATNEAIQCTAIYEYARQLATPDFMIPSFQSYKFLYATRLAEHGRAAEALQYCEAVGTILARTPTAFSPALIGQVFQLGSMLKFCDPQYMTENEGAPWSDPAWLTALEAAAATAASAMSEDYTGENGAGNEQPELITEGHADVPPSDYSSYSQQGQYGDQQQHYYSQEQPQYYDQQAAQLSENINNTQQTVPEQDMSNPYVTSQQDYSYGTAASQSYNANYSWQQPPQQQQQQPWGYPETAPPASGPTDYWAPSNNMVNHY